MLPPFLERFNKALSAFQAKYPRPEWDQSFKSNLINDFSFFSSRIEDPKLKYGDTIRFLNDQFVNKENLSSFIQLEDHRKVLEEMVARFEEFELSEDLIKDVHLNLMGSDLSWNGDFKPELIGNYRNFPVVGSRYPLFTDKEYVPHYNLEVSMSSHMDFFVHRFNHIDNSNADSHLLMALAYFHNKFLNFIHPFADGNGRVCRIIMGTIMMKNGCPPIFPKIENDDDMVTYISTIVDCELKGSDWPLVAYLANGMTDYLENRIRE